MKETTHPTLPDEPELPPENLRLEAFGAFTFRGVALVASFAAGIVVARHLGPSGKGLIAFLFLAPVLLGRITELGISGAGIHTLAGRPDRLPKVHGHLLLVTAATAVAAGVFALCGGTNVLGRLFPEVPAAWILAGVALTPVALYLYAWESLSAGLGRQRQAWRRTASVVVLYPIGAIVLALVGAEVGAFGVLVAALFVARGLLAFIDLSKTGGGIDPSPAGLPKALSFGLVVYLGHAATQMLYHVDQFVIVTWLSLPDLGCYSISAAFAGYLLILPSIVGATAMRRVTGGSAEQALEATTTVGRQSILVGAGVAVVLAVLAGPLVALLYGADFRPAVVPLLWLLPGAVAIGAAQAPLIWIIYRSGRPWLFPLAGAVAFVGHVALLVVLLPTLGIEGAAIASSAGYIAFLAICAAMFRARTGCPVHRLLLPRADDLGAYRRLLSDLWPGRRS